MNIYVDNIGRSVTADSLAAIFATYGKVNAFIISPSLHAKAERAAFVIMPDKIEAAKAVQQLHGCFIDGYALSVMLSQPETDSAFGLLGKRIRRYFS